MDEKQKEEYYQFQRREFYKTSLNALFIVSQNILAWQFKVSFLFFCASILFKDVMSAVVSFLSLVLCFIEASIDTKRLFYMQEANDKQEDIKKKDTYLAKLTKGMFWIKHFILVFIAIRIIVKFTGGI